MKVTLRLEAFQVKILNQYLPVVETTAADKGGFITVEVELNGPTDAYMLWCGGYMAGLEKGAEIVKETYKL